MLYAALMFEGNRKKIVSKAKYPCKSKESHIYDSSEEEITVDKISDEMPLRLKGFYSVIAFKPKYILLSRDVIGGKPLYYSKTEFSSFKSFVDGAKSVNPGEVIKIYYDGYVETKKYEFDQVFPPDPSKKDWGEIENYLEYIEKKLLKFKAGDCISFSGGVDSSLLAAIYDVPLVSVTANEKEEEYIKQTAKELGRELYIYRFGEKEVADALPEIVKAIEEPNPFHVSIGIPIYFSLKKAKELGFSSMMFGQGADELFGGYKKYEDCREDEVYWVLRKDVELLGINNLERDVKLSYKVEIELLTPYLQWDIIKTVMKIPGEYKVRKVGGEIIRKFALRKLAEKYLPREVAYRQKKAVQYSTKTASILEKIAKKEGLTIKGLLERYYENLGNI